jgi:hypothetical protein
MMIWMVIWSSSGRWDGATGSGCMGVDNAANGFSTLGVGAGCGYAGRCNGRNKDRAGQPPSSARSVLAMDRPHKGTLWSRLPRAGGGSLAIKQCFMHERVRTANLNLGG